MSEKAIFLDKDGTLIPDVPYNVDPNRIVLSQGAGEALKSLSDHGFKLVVVSNQSGVARGYFHKKQLEAVFARINELLETHRVVIDAFYFCSHHPEGTVPGYNIDCDCRKPLPGLIIKAATDMNIDLSQSWMVGDILNDVEAGKRAGCATVLIDNGNETEWITDNVFRHPDFTVERLEDMASTIISTSRER